MSRPIFDPFEIHIVNSKSAGGEGGKAGEGGNHPAAGAPSQWQASKTVITIPTLEINMDSREFQIALDVIRKIGLASVSCPAARSWFMIPQAATALSRSRPSRRELASVEACPRQYGDIASH